MKVSESTRGLLAVGFVSGLLTSLGVTCKGRDVVHRPPARPAYCAAVEARSPASTGLSARSACSVTRAIRIGISAKLEEPPPFH